MDGSIGKKVEGAKIAPLDENNREIIDCGGKITKRFLRLEMRTTP